MTNDSVLDLCLEERDSAEHPIPYVALPIYSCKDGSEFVDNALAQRRANDYPPDSCTYFDVPKAQPDSCRVLTLLSLEDQIEYHGLALDLAARSADLADAVSPVSRSFRPNANGAPWLWVGEPDDRLLRWRDFQSDVRTCCSKHEVLRTADVQDFFPSIRHDEVIRAIEIRYDGSSLADRYELLDLRLRLARMLDTWFPNGGNGLPQGQRASFFLADVLLLACDYECQRPNYKVLRFVDDFRIFALTSGDAVVQHEHVQDVLTRLGLRLNAEKTKTFPCALAPELRFEQLRQAFRTVTGRRPGRETLAYAISCLECELAEPNPQRHWINYLLAAIRRCLVAHGRISDALLSRLLGAYQSHRNTVGNAFMVWRGLLAALMNVGEVQELAAEMVLRETSLTDCELALGYGLFQVADILHTCDVADAVRTQMEAEASLSTDLDPRDGNVAGRKGKALRAAQKHGTGNQILMDLYRSGNYHQEMRRYTTVAMGDLPNRHRHEFAETLRRTQYLREESIPISYFRHQREANPPDRRMRPVEVYS